MVAQTYFCTLTAVGEAKDANAKALGIALKFTEMALGDGNGALPIPDRTRTSLVRQVRRGAINSMKADPANPGQVIIEQVIPESEGGWWIRELGVYDSDGDLVAIGNCPETYKPQLAEGSGRTQVVRMVLIMSSASTVQLKVDPSVVLATRKYVDDQDALHVAALDPHPQYLTKTDGAAKIAAAVSALVNASPSTLDTLAELAAALGNDKDFSAHILASLGLKAPLADPIFTGAPTAITPPRLTTSQRLATMEALRNNGANHSTVRTYAVNTVLTADVVGGLILAFGSTGDIVFELPAASACFLGASISIYNSTNYKLFINAASTNYINMNNGNVPQVMLKPGETLNMSMLLAANTWQCFSGSAQLDLSPSFGASFNSGGYAKFPNGLIEQWGFTPAGGDLNGAVVSFPIAFPNGCLNMVATDSGNTCASAGCTVISNSQFKLYGRDFNGAYGTYGIQWRARGY